MAASLMTAAMGGKGGNDDSNTASLSHPPTGAAAGPDARTGTEAPTARVHEPVDAVDLLDSFQTVLSVLHEKSIRLASKAKQAGRMSSKDARGAPAAASSRRTTIMIVENLEATSAGPADLPSQERRGEEAAVMASHGTATGVSASTASGAAAAVSGASAAVSASAAGEQLVVIVQDDLNHCSCGDGDVVRTSAGRNSDVDSVAEVDVSDRPSSDLREELQSVLRTRRTSLARQTPRPRVSPPSMMAVLEHPEPTGWIGVPVMWWMPALVVGAVLVKFGVSTLRDR